MCLLQSEPGSFEVNTVGDGCPFRICGEVISDVDTHPPEVHLVREEYVIPHLYYMCAHHGKAYHERYQKQIGIDKIDKIDFIDDLTPDEPYVVRLSEYDRRTIQYKKNEAKREAMIQAAEMKYATNIVPPSNTFVEESESDSGEDLYDSVKNRSRNKPDRFFGTKGNPTIIDDAVGDLSKCGHSQDNDFKEAIVNGTSAKRFLYEKNKLSDKHTYMFSVSDGDPKIYEKNNNIVHYLDKTDKEVSTIDN